MEVQALKDAVAAKNQTFLGNVQQDAQEFL